MIDSAGMLRLSGDLSGFEQIGLGFVLLASWILLVLELRRGAAGRLRIGLSGGLGALLLTLAVARPVRVEEAGIETGARVIALVDSAERLGLPGDDHQPRRAMAERVVADLRRRFASQRLEVLAFDKGPLGTMGAGHSSRAPAAESDLVGALSELSRLPGDRPAAVVVVSDGRLTTPGPAPNLPAAAYWDALRPGGVEFALHTVALTARKPRDLAVRSVRAVNSAVAHQAFPLGVEIGCEPADSCPDTTVVVQEMLEDAEPAELGRGVAHFVDGKAELELPVTIERAGGRVLSVALEGQAVDEVPANDRRYLRFEVRRERMRILHVAGRPTYDVRALRMFLKADESIDLVAFFILRTLDDRADAPEDELSLIPFPVEELFTEHLSSFDAVVLQDIDARQYGLDRHFPALRDYVLKGGGLILVGGPGAFAAGGYADSPLATVLPVNVPRTKDVVVQKPVEPRYTRAGLVAPMLGGLRELLGTRLPVMAGANRVGASRPSAFVLWEHPAAQAEGDARPMPLLSLADVGDGRSIALGLDGSHLLRFGELGAEVAGRAHTALWEGLLGWLMRDPRYEAARLELPEPCFAGRAMQFDVTPLPGMGEEVELSLTRLGTSSADAPAEVQRHGVGTEGATVHFTFAGVPAGAYVARTRVGSAPATRSVFACEEGGGAYADSRPDVERLSALAAQTGGRAVDGDSVSSLPLPASTKVLTHSSMRPLLPDWAWGSLAVVVLAAHFWLRRLGGFA